MLPTGNLWLPANRSNEKTTATTTEDISNFINKATPLATEIFARLKMAKQEI